jgi:hypothetical protein
MYLLTKPFIDYAHSQVESLTRLTQSSDITEMTRSSAENFWRLVQENQVRFLQSDALTQFTKANVESFSRFIQDYSRGFSALAVETQGRLTKGIQEGTRQLQQVACSTSNFVSTGARETAETVKNTAEHVAEESDATRVARRRA